MLLCDLLRNKNKGFTLIELLVVISIIGLLSTVVLAGVQKARNDAKWRAFERQLVEIRTAVQLYKSNNNGDWPNSVFSEGSLQDLVTELKNSGFYNSNKINYPLLEIDAYSCGGYKALNYPNSCSCGHNNYSETHYVIYYFNNMNYSMLPTKLSLLFYDGYVSTDTVNGLGGYYYCIEL